MINDVTGEPRMSAGTAAPGLARLGSAMLCYTIGVAVYYHDLLLPSLSLFAQYNY